MFLVTEHIPGFVGAEARTATVASLDELLALPFVKAWTRPFAGKPFKGWRRSEHRSETCLMALYGDDEGEWHVVAYAPAGVLADLPEWQISPKGQAFLDRVQGRQWKPRA